VRLRRSRVARGGWRSAVTVLPVRGTSPPRLRASAPTSPYEGEIDDVRLSKIARYATATIPKPLVAYPVDASTPRRLDGRGLALRRAERACPRRRRKLNHDGTLPPDATGATRVANARCISAR